MCFRESDGQFLYQHVSPARQGPTYNQAQTGTSCSPLIEGDRLWFVTTGAEVVCLDIGMHDDRDVTRALAGNRPRRERRGSDDDRDKRQEPESTRGHHSQESQNVKQTCRKLP